MAIGKSSSVVDQDKISIKIGENYIIKNGEIFKSYNEKKSYKTSQKKMKYLCK